ncbi:MAG: phytanoyl-CoA dioxygenase family protein, partial [Acidimicrobiia bacterium]|nr:phytanoyl-CoA dioxygenase family protein [Acidimicrobiia bacterium]
MSSLPARRSHRTGEPDHLAGPGRPRRRAARRPALPVQRALRGQRPGTGANFAWHQDSAYVGFGHRPYLTLWILLDDVDLDNGCISVLPTHVHPAGDPDSAVSGVVPRRWDHGGKQLVGYDEAIPGTAITCRAGAIVAFSSLALHR